VVIDHNDALRQRAEASLPGVIVCENREGRGLSGARNSGIAVAQGSIVAFLDDDAAAKPDWLERLATHYQDNGVLGVGGAILPQWLGGRPAWFPEEFDWVVGCTYRGMPETTAPVRNLIGCNMPFRGETLEAAGGFRADLGRIGRRPLGCEETELCIRIGQRFPNGLLLYEPAAEVRHKVPATRGQWAYFRARCYAEGLSKAGVTRTVAGGGKQLTAERAYVTRTLPRGVLRGIGQAMFQGNGAGVSRSGAIVGGLATTVAGYVAGTIDAFRRNRESMLAPARRVEVA
jgi:glycosyltransferase involved in cell wall biosynthesis